MNLVYLVEYRLDPSEIAWSTDSAWTTHSLATEWAAKLRRVWIARGAHAAARVVAVRLCGGASPERTVNERMARAEPAVTREVQRRMAELEAKP